VREDFEAWSASAALGVVGGRRRGVRRRSWLMAPAHLLPVRLLNERVRVEAVSCQEGRALHAERNHFGVGGGVRNRGCWLFFLPYRVRILPSCTRTAPMGTSPSAAANELFGQAPHYGSRFHLPREITRFPRKPLITNERCIGKIQVNSSEGVSLRPMRTAALGGISVCEPHRIFLSLFNLGFGLHKKTPTTDWIAFASLTAVCRFDSVCTQDANIQEARGRFAVIAYMRGG